VRRIGWALSDEGLALIGAELAARGQTVDPATIAQLQALYQQGAKQAAYQVRTFADAGEDAFCRWLLEDWAIMIGALFASLAPVLHPGLFVIGGGLTEMSEGARAWFLEAVQASYDAINTQGCFASRPGNCEIAWSQSTDQGWRGAILMGMRAAR
jgi:predicted NBD/HSP70 family sugar kinase